MKRIINQKKRWFKSLIKAKYIGRSSGLSEGGCLVRFSIEGERAIKVFTRGVQTNIYIYVQP